VTLGVDHIQLTNDNKRLILSGGDKLIRTEQLTLAAAASGAASN